MSAAVVALTLAAAGLHAIWNAIAHAVPDRLAAFALIGLASTAVAAVGAVVLGPPPPEAWPWIASSAAVHVAYNVLLWTSYRLGEFGQVYPLARGTSPWVVGVVAVTVLHRPIDLAQGMGVGMISAGLISMVFLGGGPARGGWRATTAALATGLFIAGYTVLDGVGVTTAPVLVYTSWLFLLQSPAMPLLALAVRGRALAGVLRDAWAPGLTGGLVSVAAYGLVLVAQTSGALAQVAALRETSIVFGAVIGAVFFKEPLGRRRSVAAAVVVAGILLISLPTV